VRHNEDQNIRILKKCVDLLIITFFIPSKTNRACLNDVSDGDHVLGKFL
jgi:hypothetical protein